MKIIRTANYKKIAQIPPVQPSQPMQFSKRQFNDKQNQSPQSANQWRTGKVFTKAPAFGPDKEIEEQRIITIRPEENEMMALKREGFDPQKSRIEIIDI